MKHKKPLLLCIRKFKNIFTSTIRYNVYRVGDNRAILNIFGKELRVYKCKIYNTDRHKRPIIGNSLKKPKKPLLDGSWNYEQ